jgi:thiol-disulfide isomerase/thioredoxin
MRGLIGFVALSLVACSSAAPTDPQKDPTKPVQPVEPAPTPVYTAPDYPAASGNNPGSIIPDKTWDAFLPSAPVGVTGKVSLHDFYDPDGTRGINALVIITSAEWCGACMSEAMTLEGKIKSKWGPDGVMVVELMLEDTQQNRAVPMVTAAADRWRAKFSLTDMAVGIDPAFTYAHSGTNGLPLNVIVDPRTMTMVSRTDGFGASEDTDIASLVAKNKLQ